MMNNLFNYYYNEPKNLFMWIIPLLTLWSSLALFSQENYFAGLIAMGMFLYLFAIFGVGSYLDANKYGEE